MKKLPQILIITGILLIISSLLLFVYIFYPVFKVEIDYRVNKPFEKSNQVEPVDTEFGIVIPKIGANSKVIEEVDPFNSTTYQNALTKGVAHAKGTVLPDIDSGNMFLFSHSSANILEASRYNSIFYLLTKMENEDEILIYYKGEKHTYKVTDKKIVDATDVSYLSPQNSKKALTLMTCWPAGTDYKRLVVTAISSE